MKSRLLDIIVCPECGKKFKCRVRKREGKEIIDGTLSCSCGASFPIVRGIPRILPKEISKDKAETASRFFFEWRTFSGMEKAYEKQFLGFIYPPVRPGFFRGKLVLDAGCGMGRHAVFASKWGAKVVGIDIGNSVDIAYENTKKLPNVHILQADIYHLPFKKEFDFAYSIGVLHHLPEPEKGFRKLLAVLKPKGSIFAWVYGREGNQILKILDPVRKNITSKCPLWFVYALSGMMMVFLYPLIKASKLSGNKDSFFRYLSGFNFRQNHSILFDQLLPPVANYYKKEEFERWFKNAGLKNIMITHRNQNSWRGFGTLK